ncbi:MAG: molecular chaperone DnaK [Candidatus Sumerlaeaceae bacterium]
MERVLGIDLGTTNSVVAYLEQGQPVIMQNAEGSRTTPSIVLYKSPEEIVVGELAKRQFVTYPKQAIRSVKRFMGARYSEARQLMEGINYEIVEGPDDSVLIDVGWTRISPEQVSAEILRKMRRTAEEFFGEQVTKAVVTVPAYFNDNQRSATKRAGELAGLDVVRMINEPTAAALAYGIEKQMQQKITVFDLGGGTFDVSVLEIDNDVFEVKSTRGDTKLGGDNFDAALLQQVVSEFHAETGVDLSTDLQALQRLREAVEAVKCELSSTTETVLSLPFISSGPVGPLHLQRNVSRTEFESVIGTFMPTLIECCKEALRDANLKAADPAAVLLVGGSTRIPLVQDAVRQYFGKEPSRSLNPDEAVAVGAAIQGAIISGGLREVLLLDVTPLSLGIELAGGLFGVLIPRNSSIPTSYTKTFTTVRDNQTSVKIHVLQGERKIALENHSLAHFRLLGITAAPKEIPAIDVCFQIDANGILHVQATDVTSGSSSAISVESYSSLAAEHAEQAIKDAESRVDEDRTFVRIAFLKSQAESMLSLANQQMADPASEVDSQLLKSLREASFRFDVAVSAASIPDIEVAYEELKGLHGDLTTQLLISRSRDLE